MTLAWIVVATLAGGVLSVVVAAGLTLAVLSRLVEHLVSLSTGVLLATALLNILPEAFEGKASPQSRTYTFRNLSLKMLRVKRM